MQSSRPPYFRITVTGDPGSGKSTFSRTIAALTGFRLITAGNIFRQLAAKKGISVTELNELAESQSGIDKMVDDYLLSLNEAEEDLIIDSRMAWHFVSDALKIRLTVEPKIAAMRIYADTAELREKFSDLDTAAEEIARRKKSEVFRYSKLYGVDISDPKNFDLVIDTSHKAPSDVTSAFVQVFDDYKKRVRPES